MESLEIVFFKFKFEYEMLWDISYVNAQGQLEKYLSYTVDVLFPYPLWVQPMTEGHKDGHLGNNINVYFVQIKPQFVGDHAQSANYDRDHHYTIDFSFPTFQDFISKVCVFLNFFRFFFSDSCVKGTRNINEETFLLTFF